MMLRIFTFSDAYLHDDLEVGNHHGHPAEQRLEVFGKLLAAGVAGVHRDEEPADGLEEDVLRVARELEKLHARLLGVLDRQHLRGGRARREVSDRAVSSRWVSNRGVGASFIGRSRGNSKDHVAATPARDVQDTHRMYIYFEAGSLTVSADSR